MDAEKFKALITQFTGGQLDANTFKRQYTTLWREQRKAAKGQPPNPALEQIVNDLYAEVDAFSSRPEDDYEIGEEQLLRFARQAQDKLSAL